MVDVVVFGELDFVVEVGWEDGAWQGSALFDFEGRIG